MQPVQDLTIDATVSRSQYQFVLEDANPNEFSTWVPKLLERLQQLPQLEDVSSNYAENGLSAYILIDRPTAARFGITPATVDNALYNSFGQRIVSTIFTQSNQYRVILEADPELQKSLSSLGQIYLPSSTATNGQVPLSAIAQVEEQTAPLEINHLGQFPSTTVSFNLAQGASLGEAVDAIKQAEQEIGMPASMITVFQGAALAFQAALGNELVLIIAAIITMYIVLGVLYESFIHPITILSTLPSAGVGALLALMIDGSDLSVIAIIGIILLIGIVKKNAIMMVDFALDAERNEGKLPREAIYQACLLALPADPDDDDGGALCRTAADARQRNRLGTAPPVGGDHCRRPDLQPVADLVYDAGHLSRLRPAGRRRCAAGSMAARRSPRAASR